MEIKSAQLFREKIGIASQDEEGQIQLRSNRLVVDRVQDRFVIRTKYLYDALRTLRLMIQCDRRRPGLWTDDCVECWSGEYVATHIPKINEREPNWLSVYRDGACRFTTVPDSPFHRIEHYASGQPIDLKLLKDYARDTGLGTAGTVTCESVPYVIMALQKTALKVWYLLRAGEVANRSFLTHLDDDRRRRQAAFYSVVYVAEKLFELNALVEESKIVKQKYAAGELDYIKSRSIHDTVAEDLIAKRDSLFRYARNVDIEWIPREPQFEIAG